MFVVALAEMGPSEESELSAIAGEVHLTAYDLRIRVAAGLPAVVLSTADRDEASRVLQWMRDRGHGALVCDVRSVIPGTAMVPVRHFALEDDGLRADRASPDVLPYRQMRVLVHVAHTEQLRVVGHELVYVSPRQGVRRQETVTQEHDSTQSLYIFRGDGERPFILRERDAHYGALGAAAGPVQHLNFLATIAALRRRRASIGLLRRSPRRAPALPHALRPELRAPRGRLLAVGGPRRRPRGAPPRRVGLPEGR